MVISNKINQNYDININIDGQKLELMDEMKYLGVIIDNKLKFDKNMDYVCKKIGRKINVINELKKELNCGQKLIIYKSIVQPHFTYCASILYIANQTDLNRLQMLQNKCLKAILNVNKYTNNKLMLDQLRLMSVNQIVVF